MERDYKSLLPLKKAERILRTQTKRGRGRKLIIEIEIEYDMEEEEENGCCRSHEKKWRNRTEKLRWIPLQPTRLITRECVTTREHNSLTRMRREAGSGVIEFENKLNPSGQFCRIFLEKKL